MRYPLDLEICVKEFMKEEKCKDTSIKFLRTYVTILNDFYAEGFNNPGPLTKAEEEAFKIETYETELRAGFKESYEKFLVQAKDAYRQGQIDAAESVSDELVHGFKDVNLISENGGV